MKCITKTFLLLAGILVLGAISPILLIADDDDEEIVVKTNTGGDGGDEGPRGLDIPIQASYNSLSHLVSVDFLSNVGMVNIDIENEDTGTISSYLVNSAISHHSFLISGDSGLWTITFTLANGAEYVGEWVVTP